MKITIKIPVVRPHCRTPIKPAQRHRDDKQYRRHAKHKGKGLQ